MADQDGNPLQGDDLTTSKKRGSTQSVKTIPKQGHDFDGESPVHFSSKVYQPPTPNLTPRSDIAAEPPPHEPWKLEKQLLVIYGATSRTGQWMVRNALQSGIFRVRAFCRSKDKLQQQQEELDKKPPGYEPPKVKTRAQLPGLDDILFGAHLEEERPQNCSRSVVDKITPDCLAMPELLEIIEGDITDVEKVQTTMRDANYCAILVKPDVTGKTKTCTEAEYLQFIAAVADCCRKPMCSGLRKLYVQSHADLPEPAEEVPEKGDPKIKAVTGLKKEEAEALFKTMVFLKRECKDLPWFCSRAFPLVEGPTAWKQVNNVIGFPPDKKPQNKGMKFSGIAQWSLLIMQNRTLWIRQFPYMGYGTDHLQYYQTGEKALAEMEEAPPGATDAEKAKFGLV
ncbi:unnamed protein product [Amoebophrya sp. A120]|nr:unnamed protein product [Amoebophrya sp. A120]|eukprot:GSA120T00007300001.1